MKVRTSTIVFIGVLLLMSSAHAQGTFQNLDFEAPVLPLVRDGLFQVSAARALPGWSAFIGGTQVDRVNYDAISLSGAAITFLGPGAGEPVIQGRYRVLLQDGYWPSPPTVAEVAIAQTGTVPSTALSVRFYSAWGTPAVYFSGRLLPTTVLRAGPNGSELNGADISSFAGQFGELRFEGGGILDNIFFSPQAIPEPGTWALLVVGGALLGWLRGRTRR